MRWGSKPVSAVRRAMRSTFFWARPGMAAAARRAASSKAAMRGGFKATFASKTNELYGVSPFSRPLRGRPGGGAQRLRLAVQIDVHVAVTLVEEMVSPPAQHPGLDHLVALAVRVQLE